MSTNRWIKKISIALISFIAILFIFSFYISYFLNDRLPKIIIEKNDTPYNLTYGELSFSLFNSSLNLKNVNISPKDSTSIVDSIKATGKVKEINIVGINFLKLITVKEVSAYSIHIDSPIVNYYLKENNEKKDTTRTKVGDSFNVSRIKIKNGTFNLLSSSGNEKIVNVSNFNINFKGVKFNERTADKKIPFKYSSFDIKLDSMFFIVKDRQIVKSKKVHFSDTTFELSDFSMKPFGAHKGVYLPNKTDADLFDVKTSLLSLTNMDWGFTNEDKLYFNTDKLLLREPKITIIQTDYSRRNDSLPKKINLKNNDTDLINVKKFQIENGKINSFFSDAKTIKYNISDVDLAIEGIKMNDFTRTNEIPIDYNTFKLNLRSMYYRLNHTHSLTASTLNLGNFNLTLKDFKMKPILSKKEFKNKFTKSNVLLDIETPILKLNKYKWGLKNGDFYFHTNSIKFNNANVKIIEQKNDNILVDNKNKLKDKLIDFNLSVDTIKVNQSKFSSDELFDFNDINLTILGVTNINGKVLNINDIILKKPKLLFYNQSKKNNQKSDKNSKEFENSIYVKRIRLQDGNLEMISKTDNKKNLILKDIQLFANHVKIDKNTVRNNIPFVYGNLELTSSGIDYDISNVYKLKTSTFIYKNGNLILNQLKLFPNISRENFTKSLKKQKDLYTVSVDKITSKNLKIGFLPSKNLFIKSDLMVFDKLYANIFRSLLPPNDLSKKTMFSQKLRELKMDLQINQVNLVQSKLEYEEEAKKTEKTGKLIFSNINTSIKNINSGFNKKSLPNVIIDWDSEFMNGDLKVKWVFNPMNTSEKFNIKGSIANLPAKNLDPFLVPYFNVSANGKLNKINFDFDGDDIKANGVFSIHYNDLKVSLLREGGSKRKFLSAVGNVAIKKDSRGNEREKEVKNVTRKQDKSFFNFFLACILDGLKKALLII
ncbi:hypothetical protein [Chishuiella sp.]|uniref:hypothetical protein n=1 Tax=Chishuiella sp. TaxID=1969467 RepID=UPI0028AE3DBA|nr:hypothetical protein [Chishuiella sp.]